MTLIDEPPCLYGEHDWSHYGNYCVKCGLVSASRRKRTAAARGGGLSKNQHQIKLCLERDGYQCYYCHVRFVEVGAFYETAEGVRATRDHVLPKSKGGGSRLENLVAACSLCNVKKGDETLEGRYGVWLKPGPIRQLKLRAAGGAKHAYLAEYAYKHASVIPVDFVPAETEAVA